MHRPYLRDLLLSLKYFLLPLGGALYPAVFHYANNVNLIFLSSLFEMSVFLTGIGLISYFIFIFVGKGKFIQASVSTFFVLLFFHVYGYVFDGLRLLDLFQVELYNFYPFWFFLLLYVATSMLTINSQVSIQIWNTFTFILGILLVFNFTKIIPSEFEKRQNAIDDTRETIASTQNNTLNQEVPDIYYLIFDEAAGFEVIRRYWEYDKIDDFVKFLDNNGFYVAEESHAESINTVREISTRLNYKQYPIGNEYFNVYSDAIGNNRVMAYLKEQGYTVVAYDQRRDAYPTMLPVPADYLFEISPDKISKGFIFLDDYKILVLNNTMLRSFLNQDPSISDHKDMILYTTENAASTTIPSPKFVYIHLLLPHEPFAFSELGITATNNAEYLNWQRYFENYKFFLHTAKTIIENILLATNGNAVIIFQSDHGARNKTKPYSGNLENYPEEYQTWIINSWYIPDCDDAPLTQDMNPANTFPIIFNCYFEENIPLE